LPDEPADVLENQSILAWTERQGPRQIRDRDPAAWRHPRKASLHLRLLLGVPEVVQGIVRHHDIHRTVRVKRPDVLVDDLDR
jgi:hypothetical protein